MVNRQQLLLMLTEALSLEEIVIIPLLEDFLRKGEKCGLDEMTKTIVEGKVRHLLGESIEHSRMLTEMIREVARSDRDAY